mmetsp:Transcript_72363/g.169552  ORF Transcript_72363/g.169552 Transcript_72363/m.169552 type:complete len:257 (+) Transcript_72363:52-822(+)|eukprot:s416_g4.t1
MEMSLGALNAPARPDTLLSGDGDESWSMLANLKSPMHPDLDLEGDGGDGVPDETLTASGKLCSWQDRAVSRSSAPSSSTALDDETDFSLSVLTEESEAHGDIDPWFAEDMEEFGDGGLPEEPMMRKVNSTNSFRKHAVRARRERIRSERREVVFDFLKKNNFGGVNAPRSRSGFRLLSESVFPLHVAAQQGDAHMVQALLREGADPAKKTSTGRTALDMAYVSNQFGSHRMVLEILSGRWNTMSFRDLRAISRRSG